MATQLAFIGMGVIGQVILVVFLNTHANKNE